MEEAGREKKMKGRRRKYMNRGETKGRKGRGKAREEGKRQEEGRRK